MHVCVCVFFFCVLLLLNWLGALVCVRVSQCLNLSPLFNYTFDEITLGFSLFLKLRRLVRSLVVPLYHLKYSSVCSSSVLISVNNVIHPFISDTVKNCMPFIQQSSFFSIVTEVLYSKEDIQKTTHFILGFFLSCTCGFTKPGDTMTRSKQ